MIFNDDDDFGGSDTASLLMSKEELEEETNCYIKDPDNAANLISIILEDNNKSRTIDSIRDDIKEIFRKFGNICIKDEIESYEKFISIIRKLYELNKYQQISDKSVIGVGGHFSAGKSRFISSIIGCAGLLPENGNPTTSIPTYIIKGTIDHYSANNVFGSSCELTAEQMHSISHEFYNKWNFGFAAFLENIVVSSRKWQLPDNVAILDTPGTEKADNKSEESLSDSEKAKEQLKAADHIIWLMDIDNGELKSEDIKFIGELKRSKPILIVINKADAKDEYIQKQIMEQVKRTVSAEGIKCYGISVYSSMENKEYMYCTFGGVTCGKDETLISNYIKQASRSASYSSIMSELEETERTLLSNIIYNYNTTFDADSIRDLINVSSQVMDIRSLALLYRSVNAETFSRQLLDHNISAAFDELNKEVEKLLEEMKNV